MLLSKGRNGYGEPKNVIAASVQKMHSPLRASKLPGFVYRSICPTMEIWKNWELPISKVPCLHQGIAYIKRKLRVWGASKCNRCVGAKKCTRRYGPPNYQGSNSAEWGRQLKFGGYLSPWYRVCINAMLYQKEATGMGSLKLYLLCRCKKRTWQYGPPNYQGSYCAV